MNESGTNYISKRLKILLRMSKVGRLILGLIVILSILGYVLVDSDSEKENENLTTFQFKIVIEIDPILVDDRKADCGGGYDDYSHTLHTNNPRVLNVILVTAGDESY